MKNYKDLSKNKPKYWAGLKADEFSPRKDLRGLKFGRLTVVDFSHKAKYGRKYYYKCLCDCGKHCVKSSQYLLDKNNPHKSCGCWHRELNIQASTTHGCGSKKNPTYKAWCEIKGRCYNPNSTYYCNYGGRGIKMCQRWFDSFANFLADMGDRPSESHSIDRIDVNGDYCPENCRWATRREQCNNRRNNINIIYNGKTQTLAQWCRELGLRYSYVREWMRDKHLSFEEVLTKPKSKLK